MNCWIYLPEAADNDTFVCAQPYMVAALKHMQISPSSCGIAVSMLSITTISENHPWVWQQNAVDESACAHGLLSTR